MAYNVTELWSQKDTTQERNGWGATRYFSVIGTTAELLDGRGVVEAQGIPQRNESHPNFRDLRVSSKSAGPGLTERIVSVRYQWMPAGGDPDVGEDDPLNQTPTVTWSIAQRTESIDRDIYGSPLANSAGDAFDSLPQVNRFGLALTIVRWESFYDVFKARAFFERVNKDLIVAGGVQFLPRTMLCTGIIPADTFKVGQSPIPISYSFEIRSTQSNQQPASIAGRPFAWWVADMGLRSFASGKKSPLDLRRTNDPSNLINAAVRFNGTGIPMDTAEFCVVSTGGTPSTPIANPTPLSTKVQKVNAGNAWYLGYDIYEEADFLQLGL
jgi:hypothetical protein